MVEDLLHGKEVCETENPAYHRIKIANNHNDFRLLNTCYFKNNEEVRAFIIISIIFKEFSDFDLSVRSLSQRMGVSESTIIRCLKKKGLKFSDVLWATRLSKAIKWLCDPTKDSLRISELAYASGFKSPAHLSRELRKLLGMAPRTLRKWPARGQAFLHWTRPNLITKFHE